MRSLPRTEAEIQKEINRLIEDDNNFISDNYGSEAADNGEYEIYFSKYQTEETLKRFAKWLITQSSGNIVFNVLKVAFVATLPDKFNLNYKL